MGSFGIPLLPTERQTSEPRPLEAPPPCEHGSERRAQHGAAHPRPACPLTCGNLGAALRRGERPPESGPAPLAPPPAASAVPSAVTTSPYRLATPSRAPPLARPRPRPLFPAPALGAGPALRVPFPLCASARPGAAAPPPAPLSASGGARRRRRSARERRSAARGRGGARLAALRCPPRCARDPPPSRPPPRPPPSPPPSPPPPAERLRRAGAGITPGPAQGGTAPALIGLRRGVNRQPMWRGRRRWWLLK